MNDLLGTIFTPWGWLIAGVILAGLEILLPGAFLMWLAGAALATAAHAALFGLDPTTQLLAFAGWTGVALLVSRRVKKRRPITSDNEQLNRRAAQLEGAGAIVVQAIAGGHGKVRLGDTEWLAQGPDAPVGTRVRVVRADGTILRVLPEPDQPSPSAGA
ncbi:MAG: NfeD family protein [Sphingomonadaceae bacterium]